MKRRKIIFGICLGIVLVLTLYPRLFPVYFPQLKKQAKNIVYDRIRQIAMGDIQKKFPHFYPTAKDRIAKSRVKQYISLNKKEIKNQTQAIYQQLKDRFQDDRGQTYIMELDCWHWARYVENVVQRGSPGDQTIAGREWDYYMLAPNGYYLQWQQLLYYASAYLYKIFRLFRQVELYNFLFYLPLFFTAIFIVISYLFSYRYSGHLGAIISCIFIGLAPTFLHRSCVGWFDKDILNLLFPVLVIWTYIEGQKDRPLKKRLLWIIFSSFWLGLFCFNWTHWWFVFFILIAYEIIYLISLFFIYFFSGKDKIEPAKKHVISLICFLIGTLFWVLIISGKEPIRVLCTETFKAIFLTKPLVASVWPNVLYTVGELRNANIASVSRSLGGIWVFASTAICMILLLIRTIWYNPYRESKHAAIIILNIWFAAMLFACFTGIRFVMFLIVPLGICTGWLIDEIYKKLKNNKNTAGILLLSITLVVPGALYLKISHRSATGIYPLINDTWYRVLNIVKEKTPQNAILNSWWDFGDWFKVIARRRVIFDGQSQVHPQAYWMAKAILSHNEGQAIAILRMLNNGGNMAFEVMDKHIQDPLEAVLLLEKVMVLNPERARELLKNYLPQYAVKKVINLLFSTPAPAYFVVDDTMVPKIGAISYLGNWDFSKVYIAQNLDIKEEQKIIERLVDLGRDKGLIQKFHQEAFLITPNTLDDWLSNRLQFYSPLVNGKEQGEVVLFANGYIYNPKEKTVYSKNGHIPRSLFIFEDEDNDIQEITYNNANVIYSALISEEGDGVYKLIFLDRELGKSLFSRLYFFKGRGLKHFHPFIDVEESNKFIRIYNMT
ncbi:MAG: hypothetical protein KAS46_06855 [Candidatus Aureabacteria bacterium]|nr:hypothetical protein [Candidatus Auribacterota bacterium]